jgi:RNA polymerase sporulation-specific sigma factor
MDQISDMNDVESRMNELTIRDAISGLGERERNILYLRFFRGKTQVEVAGEIGISQAQVSRLEKSAIERIKNSV